MHDSANDHDLDPNADLPGGEPERVAVTGTSGTADVEITMLEGATGARIPTGNHRASGAMPASGVGSGSNSRGVLTLVLTLAALVIVAVLVYALFLA